MALAKMAHAEQHNDQTVAKQIKAEQDSAALRQKNVALEQELQACKTELLACKDDLYRLQPTTHVPDSKIAGHFNDLDMGICTWIDAEISRYSDERQKNCPDVAPKLFNHGGHRWVDELLGNHAETAGEHLVRCMIQRQLYKCIFSERIYLFGLGNDQAIFRIIEREMSQLKPPRGR